MACSDDHPKLGIVLLGYRYAGKSSAGNTILGREEFELKRNAQCVKRQGEVAGRHITVVEAPGWWRDVSVEESTELLKQEIVFSVSLCPPGPHAVLLLISADSNFRQNKKKVLEGYLHLLSDKIWSHTIVLFTYGDWLGDTPIEQHIESEGKELQWLVEKCGNRYHVLNNENRDDTQVTELLEKIEEMVAGNNGQLFSAMDNFSSMDRTKIMTEHFIMKTSTMSEDENSDIWSLRSSLYSSFRSRSGADNSSICSGYGSWDSESLCSMIDPPLIRGDKSDTLSMGSSAYGSFRTRSGPNSRYSSTRSRASHTIPEAVASSDFKRTFHIPKLPNFFRQTSSKQNTSDDS